MDDQLVETIAKKMFQIGAAADLMITADDSDRLWKNLKKNKDQIYLSHVWTAQTAIAAMEELRLIQTAPH